MRILKTAAFVFIVALLVGVSNPANGQSQPMKQVITPRIADGAQDVHSADLDGDGDDDVLFASEEDNKVAWYENTSGGFSTQKVITTNAGGAQSVYAAKLDGDSDLDVLSASSTDDKIAWYENTGSGFSTQKVITTSASGAQSVYAADLDGDSDPDVLVASSDDEISAYDNQIDNNGGFGAELVVTTNPKEVQSVHAADLGGDSKPDVLSASSGDDTIAWYENKISNGNGFGFQNVVAPSGNVETIRDVSSIDIDSDGSKEIVSASESDDKISIYDNLDGVFSAQQIVTKNADRPMSLYVDDIDGDSNPDLLSASRGDSKIAWYRNEGGELSNQNIITTNAEGAISVYSIDIDGDSDADVVSASEGDFDQDPKIAWYENEGSGTFSSQKLISTDVPLATSVYAADLDGDGDGDVISGSAGSPDKVAWYENTDGEGNFSTQKIISTNTGEVQTVTASDLDDDGDMDVLSASETDDKVAWYENTDGDGSFSDQKIISENANGAQDISVVDLNGDGDKDVVSVEVAAGTNKIRWYEQSTSFGSIAWEPGVIDGLRGVAVHTADLTGNGFQDVIAGVVPNPLDQVVWYENTSSVLPVEMTGIEANRTRDGAILHWRTASEQNNAGFEIQRRVDTPEREDIGLSSSWKETGFVQGNGTTNQPQSYRFEDSFKGLPFAADTVAYRLQQVDTDGSTSYSKVVRIERSVSHLQIQSIAPKPASQKVTVRYALPDKVEFREATFRIYDALGREVRSVQIDTHSGRQIRRLTVKDLASGTYFLRLSTDGKTVTKKLTVVK